MVAERQWEEFVSPADPPSAPKAPTAGGWVSGDAYVASPARELQGRLQRAYAPSQGFPEPEVERWPGAVRAGVLAGLVVVSWSLVLGGVWMGVDLARSAQAGRGIAVGATPTRSGRLAPL